MKTNKLLLGIFVSILLLNACKDDDDATPGGTITPNEEELITTVRLIFNEPTRQTTDTFHFRDPDGEGGNAPTIDTLVLMASSNYSITAQFLDESDPNDVEDITEEIEREDDEHLVCFVSDSLTGIQINRTDSDGTYEVGLESSWVTSSTFSSIGGKGNVTLTLKHQPEGIKDGTCSPGDTDVEVKFPVKVN